MLKIVKDFVLRTSRFFGFEVLRPGDIEQRDFAIHLGRLFAEFEIDCVFDVGANTGQYRDFLRDRIGYHGPIVSFEPVARNVDILRQRSLRDRHWVIEGYALGAAPGSASLKVAAESQFSSFRESDYSKVPRVDGFNVVDHDESVIIRTLDDVFPPLRARLGFQRPYLKLDTQGYDMEVLRGAGRTLPMFSALQTELSVIAIYKNVPDYLESIKFLTEHHFDVSGLFPIKRDLKLRVIEFDCVTVNRAVAQLGQEQRLKAPPTSRTTVDAHL
ncbi:MAG TPA: FkbM family methyltransferase [Alphaproteobacteria bacterium]